MINVEVVKQLSTVLYGEDIVKRLDSLTYEATTADVYLIMYGSEKVTNHIKAHCCIGDIPVQMKEIFVDMVCAEVLFHKYHTNQLIGFSVDEAIKEVTMGDVSVTYGGVTGDDKFNSLIASLRAGEGDLVCYRRIPW